MTVEKVLTAMALGLLLLESTVALVQWAYAKRQGRPWAWKRWYSVVELCVAGLVLACCVLRFRRRPDGGMLIYCMLSILLFLRPYHALFRRREKPEDEGRE